MITAPKHAKKIVLALMLAALSGLQLTATPTYPRFKKCKRPPLKIPKGQDYEFGYLEVLENRAHPNGPTIQLPVYIFKCRSATPAKDPILYTVGGPGATTIPSAQYARYYDYLEDRDFIFFEQRGTTYAKPCLDCPEWDGANNAAKDPRLNPVALDSLYLNAAQNCRDRLVRKGIDLNAYNSQAIVADIEDLRQVLKIKQWNLLTISYSCKIAQLLMRDHPESIRSVVMDSPLLIESNYEETALSNSIGAMDKLFQDCALDSSCNQTFPNLKTRFYRYLEELQSNPLELKAIYPKTQEELTFRLTGADLFFLYTPDATRDVPNIPKRIQRLLEGDYSEVQTSLETILAASGKSQLAMGMRISVWCAEEYPFVDSLAVQAEMDRYPMLSDASPWVIPPAVCDVWRVSPALPSANLPLSSDIPTLVMSGSYDPITPVEWGAQLVRRLSNGYHITFPGWTHTPTTYWSKPCGMAVARAFFNDPNRKPEVPCHIELGPPAFELPGK